MTLTMPLSGAPEAHAPASMPVVQGRGSVGEGGEPVPGIVEVTVPC